MEVIYVRGEEIDDYVMLPQIQAGEVEPYCARCKAKLNVRRMTDGRIHRIDCPTNQNHLWIDYHYKPEPE